MNKQIKELWEKAFFDASTSRPSETMYYFNDLKMQHFAKLILKRCMDIIVENKTYASEHKWPATELANVCLYEIDKTFGVNEDGKETVSG